MADEPWSAWVRDHAVIVLEGGDGVGKTTAARHLADAYGFTEAHAGLTPSDADVFERHRASLDRPGRHVLDRSFVSEAVYGALFRAGSRLSPDQLVHLAWKLSGRGGLLVHVTAPVEVVTARLTARGEHVQPGVVAGIRERYDDVLAGLAPYVRIEQYDTS